MPSRPSAPPPPPSAPLLRLAACLLAAAAATGLFASKTLRARTAHDARVVEEARDLARRAGESAARLSLRRQADLAERDRRLREAAELSAEAVASWLESLADAGDGAPPEGDGGVPGVLAGARWAGRGPFLEYYRHFLRHARSAWPADRLAARLQARAGELAGLLPPGGRLALFENSLKPLLRWPPAPLEAAPPGSVDRDVDVWVRDRGTARGWRAVVTVPPPAGAAGPLSPVELADLLDAEFAGQAMPPPGDSGRSAAAWRLWLLEADGRQAAPPFPPSSPESGHWPPALAGAAVRPRFGPAGAWRRHPVPDGPEREGWAGAPFPGGGWSTRLEPYGLRTACPWEVAVELSRREPGFGEAWLGALAHDRPWAAALGLLWLAALAQGTRGWALRRASRNAAGARAAAGQAARTAPIPGDPAPSPVPPPRVPRDSGAASAGSPAAGAPPAGDPASPLYEPPAGASLARLREEWGASSAPFPGLEPEGSAGGLPGRAANPLLRALARRVRGSGAPAAVPPGLPTPDAGLLDRVARELLSRRPLPPRGPGAARTAPGGTDVRL